MSADVRRRPPPLVFAALACLLAAAIGAASLLGAYRLDPLHLIAHDALGGDARAILVTIRLPRVALATLVGATLGISGAALQGLFRNPLADPGLIGVTSGASLGAVAFIVLSSGALASAMPIGAMAGGLGAALLVWGFSRGAERSTDTATLLLAGVAVNSIAGAIVGLLIARSDDAQLRTLTFWLMGGLSDATWPLVLLVLPTMLVAILALVPLARPLNALALGERDAFALGLDVERNKNLVVGACALGVGGAVCASGGIGFVGLVVPHIARSLFGPDHRIVLPASALIGASALILADLGARTVAAPAELPVGVMTALMGGPFFLWLLSRVRKELPS